MYIGDLTLEDVIYDFLESINSLKDLFILKGCYALKYHIKDLNKFRNTKDIDFHCFCKEDWLEFIEQFEKVSFLNSRLGLSYTLVKRRGFDKNPNSDRLTIEARFHEQIVETFTIDMNVGAVVDFDVLDNGLRYYSLVSILADKLHVLQSIKICRRIKDFIDIYCIATHFDFELNYLINKIKDRFMFTNREFVSMNELFFLDQENVLKMKHAYEKYSCDIKFDVSFDEAYDIVFGFAGIILSSCVEDEFNYSFRWNHKKRLWDDNN